MQRVRFPCAALNEEGPSAGQVCGTTIFEVCDDGVRLVLVHHGERHVTKVPASTIVRQLLAAGELSMPERRRLGALVGVRAMEGATT